ncbi:ATP-binding protein [Streptomyces sp. JNUCC 63]
MTGFGDCDDVMRDTAKDAPDLVRLLPWTGANGQPCLLLTDGDGTVSRLADRIEEMQLALGERLLGRSRALLTMRGVPTAGELGILIGQLSDALDDVLRIARSRGARFGGGPQGLPVTFAPLAFGQFSLPGDDLASAPTVRRQVRDTARSWGLPPGVTDDLETIAGELVANALEHSDSLTVMVACALTARSVTISVTDEGKTGAPVPSAMPTGSPGPDQERGRVLLITEALATRWGTWRTRAGSGLTVWAEILIESAAPVRYTTPAPTGCRRHTGRREDP